MTAETTERRIGAYSLLSLPALYRGVQNALGPDESRRRFVDEEMQLSDGERVLDVGCGTGDLAEWIPTAEYLGFDPNPAYIESAQAAPGRSHATYWCAGIDEVDPGTIGKVDVVVAKGVLHHLSDDQVDGVARLAAQVLRPGGRFVSVDPTFVDGQRKVAKFLVSRDRGINVRSLEGYRAALATHFLDVEVRHRSDYLRLPYDHAVVHAARPRTTDA